MLKPVIHSHTHEAGYRWPVVASVIGHTLLLLFFLFAVKIFPAGEPLLIGSGLGGGQGEDFVSVGLSPELSGGAGMYKPSVTPQPAALPPPAPRKTAEAESQPTQPENVFVEKGKRRPGSRATQKSNKANQQAAKGTIPRRPDPGSGGPGGRSTGSGGGFGGGQGVTIGSGTGEGVMDSWYARQVEQRIGQNWLKTSLGRLSRPVQTIISFEIRANGTIENVEIQKDSGLGTVDLAAQRAVLASSPLPPLPYEFRNRLVKFIAYFQYPPK